MGDEFYDLVNDPYQLNNIVGSLDPAFLQAVNDRLDALYSCAGAAQCGPIEDAPLPVSAVP
jgi:hypothetical protein